MHPIYYSSEFTCWGASTFGRNIILVLQKPYYMVHLKKSIRQKWMLPLVVDRLARVSRQDIVLCDIVKAELYYGAYKSTRLESNLALYREFFREFVSLPFDGNVAVVYGRIRMQLEVSGTPIGPNDLQIAAIAITNNLILVTHNTREFSRVAELRLEDWELPI